jgi:hypothetical protein
VARAAGARAGDPLASGKPVGRVGAHGVAAAAAVDDVAGPVADVDAVVARPANKSRRWPDVTVTVDAAASPAATPNSSAAHAAMRAAAPRIVIPPTSRASTATPCRGRSDPLLGYVRDGRARARRTAARAVRSSGVPTRLRDECPEHCRRRARGGPLPGVDLDSDGEFDDASGGIASKIFPAAGDDMVSLRVNDDRGASAIAVQSVSVHGEVPPPDAAVPPGRSAPVSRPPSPSSSPGALLLSPFPVVHIRGRILGAHAQHVDSPRRARHRRRWTTRPDAVSAR